MASLNFSPLVRERTTVSGTGNAALLGAAAVWYQTFNNGYGVGPTFYYAIVDPVAGAWEFGIGSLTNSTTLQRTTVLKSTNSNSLVSFAGNTSWVYSDVDASWFTAANNGGSSGAVWPPRTISGLNLVWNSTTQLTVKAGQAIDATNSVNMTLANDSTIATGTTGLGGVDVITAAGTASASGFTVTGSSTAFLTAFGTRVLSGTVTTSGTTATGTSTKFLSQVQVGDLVGNSSLGYSQVAAVPSDTALTTVGSLGASSATLNCIEQPTIKVGSVGPLYVQAIASNTSLTSTATFGTVAAGSTVLIGGVPNENILSRLLAYLVVQSGTTGVILSTQRTTLLTSVSSYRVIGSWITDGSTNFLRGMTQSGDGLVREYQIGIAAAFPVNNANAPGAWTVLSLAAYVPSTARRVRGTFSSTGGNISVFSANTGITLPNPPLAMYTGAGSIPGTYDAVCDAAQNIVWNSSGNGNYIINPGWYSEVL